MIKEQYVSFETAKLLKEKGFREICNHYYNAQYNQIRTVSDTFMMDWNDEDYMRSITMPNAISIPTQQMAMRWLRENYNILIYINFNGDINHYCWAMIDLTSGNPKPYEGLAMTYEEAAEEAIKYCLENLI